MTIVGAKNSCLSLKNSIDDDNDNDNSGNKDNSNERASSKFKNAQVEFFDKLAAEMKQRELKGFETNARGELVVPLGSTFVARLDGHCFSSFTKGLAWPFDRRLAAAMRRTMIDLLREFSGSVTGKLPNSH